MGAKISKGYFSHSFDPISSKLYDKCVGHGKDIGYYFWSA